MNLPSHHFPQEVRFYISVSPAQSMLSQIIHPFCLYHYLTSFDYCSFNFFLPSFVCSLAPRSFIRSSVHSLTRSLIRIRSFVRSLTPSLARSFIRFVRSFIHSLTRSLIRSCLSTIPSVTQSPIEHTCYFCCSSSLLTSLLF